MKEMALMWNMKWNREEMTWKRNGEVYGEEKWLSMKIISRAVTVNVA